MSSNKTPLTWEQLYNNYLEGYFPMADEWGEITWHSPVFRAVFSITNYKPKKSLKAYLKPEVFHWSINHAFEDVIRSCAQPRSEHDGTWLTDELINAYLELHRQGFAHSIEVYQDNVLVGGLYGVQIGSAFFGESMFSMAPNASKVAFHHLMQLLKENNYMLMDSQYLNDHTEMLGAVEIPDFVFTALLKQARTVPNKFSHSWE
jgi:leucyl/phenylalanyl-tRNA--protein transferase